MVTLVDAEEVLHTVYTDSEVYYKFNNLHIRPNTVITVIVELSGGGNKIYKDIIPLEVTPNENYNADIADALSTSTALVLEALIGLGMEQEDINLQEITGNSKFSNLTTLVQEALDNNQDVTTDTTILALAEEIAEYILNPSLLATPPPAPVLSNSKEINSYVFLTSNNEALSTDVTGTIDSDQRTVDLTVPSGTNVTALVATFTLSDFATAQVGGVDQISGTTSNNFGSPVTYTVTAQDGTTQDWTVWLIYGLVYNITQKTNHSTIQEALDSGQSDDIIEARGNEFSESITFPNGKAIVLRNASGATLTIIGLIDATTVTFPDGCSEGTTLEGFTITHNLGDLARGIKVNGTTGTLTLNECTISVNSAGIKGKGGGIDHSYKEGEFLTIKGCSITNNSSIQAYSASIYLRGLDSGGAITIGGSKEADKNTICGNYVTGNPPTLDDQIGNGSTSLYNLYEDTNNISDVCRP